MFIKNEGCQCTIASEQVLSALDDEGLEEAQKEKEQVRRQCLEEAPRVRFFCPPTEAASKGKAVSIGTRTIAVSPGQRNERPERRSDKID
jgi:hypothetical protein